MIRLENIWIGKPGFNGEGAYFNAVLLWLVMLRFNEAVTFQDILSDRALIDWVTRVKSLN